MVRKLLIILALIIAVAPFIGISHAAVQGTSVSLALFIAAVLLFSRKPRTTPVKHEEVAVTPSSVALRDTVSDAPMQEISVAHSASVAAHTVSLNAPVAHAPTPLSRPRPLPLASKEESVEAPVVVTPRKRSRPAIDPIVETVKAPSTSDSFAARTGGFEAVRRTRRGAAKLLSQEEQVHPADQPLPPRQHYPDDTPSL